MKTIKAVTDFGIQDVKTIGTKKEIFGEYWIVANYPVKYMNAVDPLIIRRVIHYNTGMNLPISNIPFNAPAKDYLIDAEYFLKSIPKDYIMKEVSKFKILN